MRSLITMIAHLLCGMAAYVAVGALHSLSGGGIWSLFPDAHQVRQFSVYLLDVLPFFIFALLVLGSLLGRAAEGFPRLLGLGASAVPMAIALHSPFFPTSTRAAILFMVMGLIHVSGLAVLNWALGRFAPRGIPFPATASWKGLVVLAVLGFGYPGFFQVGARMGWIPAEEETFREALEPSPEAATHVAAPGDPLARLFEREALPFTGAAVKFFDMDSDGLTDALVRADDNRLELWRNMGGRFEKVSGFLEGVSNRNVLDFYPADYDGDGKMDLIYVQAELPAETGFRKNFLKKLFWYPWSEPVSKGRLYRQLSIDRWEDVTERAFPGGTAPWAFVKVEPILWFDADGDGRLDFIWPQYPHPQRQLNGLFIQQSDGTFKDRFAELVRSEASRIYPEGSDVADVDGDGEIDLFAFGFPFLKKDGIFRQLCGDRLEGIPCASYGRTDEGGLFEDIDGDGALDIAWSYHGSGGRIPKYYLQLFSGKDGGFTRRKDVGRQFYGFNVYMRAADFDLDGRVEVLTQNAGRLLRFMDGRWLDLLPAMTGLPSHTLDGLSWVDVEGDGDVDFVARDLGEDRFVLYRNGLNPRRTMWLAARGESGRENQYGATFRIGMPDGSSLVRAYRAMSGYSGLGDPRIVLPFAPDTPYRINLCYPSMAGTPGTPPPIAGVRLEVVGIKNRCVDYTLTIVDPMIERIDLTLIAGQEVARAVTNRMAP